VPVVPAGRAVTWSSQCFGELDRAVVGAVLAVGGGRVGAGRGDGVAGHGLGEFPVDRATARVAGQEGLDLAEHHLEHLRVRHSGDVLAR